MLINYRVFTMPGKQRLSWKFNNYRQSLCVAADQDTEMVLIQCGAGMTMTKKKALQFANILVDVAEQLPD